MPKIVDHEQRRAELADAALDVIAHQGIKAVTLRAVARAAGWSTGVLNHYYESHHALLVGALRRAAEIQGRMFKEIRGDAAMDPMSRLHKLIESVLPLDDRRVAMTRIFLVFSAEAAATPEAREEVADYLHNWRRVVRRVIAEAQEAGQLPAELDAGALAAELVALSDGLAMHAMLDEDVLDQLVSRKKLRIELIGGAWRLGLD
ncbi:MAG: TetR family transcriptional regulator [Streptosporangiales bacterium]|nr:TetR family transcriptional regulator [Streptosporangiales bacterium]